jgi:ABC-type glycerol-3-phosphate transport system substrate-binding protein
MNDGLVLFYFCPDWRSKQFEMDLPNLKGKLGLIPLPSLGEKGSRTSTWGGTGLAITKASQQQELAWKLAKYLYLNEKDLASRFRETNIIPPLKSSWNTSAFHEKKEFYGGQSIGRLYSELAKEAPSTFVSPYTKLAEGKITETYLDAVTWYQANGSDGLEESIFENLKTKADYVRQVLARNVFLSKSKEVEP